MVLASAGPFFLIHHSFSTKRQNTDLADIIGYGARSNVDSWDWLGCQYSVVQYSVVQYSVLRKKEGPVDASTTPSPSGGKIGITCWRCTNHTTTSVRVNK
jgi:hypothetical protein